MLDILCDYLVLTKEATNGMGVQYPQPTAIQVTESKMDSPSKDLKSEVIRQPLPAQAARPMTSGAARTQNNFY